MMTVGVFNGWRESDGSRWVIFCGLGEYECICVPRPRMPRIGDIVWFITDEQNRIQEMWLHESENE